MNRVTNKLKLIDGSNEETIVNAISALELRVKNAEDDLDKSKKAKNDTDDSMNKMKCELDEAEDKFKKMQNDYDKMKNDFEAKNAEDDLDKKMGAKNAADLLITNAVKAGKIKNEVKAIEKWTDLAINDFEGTKEMVDGLGINKVAPHFETLTNEAKAESVVAGTMAEMRNKFKI